MWCSDLELFTHLDRRAGEIPRFLTPVRHTLVYTWRQKRNFYFTHPYAIMGSVDPAPEHEGRRVFVADESLGEDLDGLLTIRYNLDVAP